MEKYEFIKQYCETFQIPLIDDCQQVWFFRTQGGKYYTDFVSNNYIALGWNEINPDYVLRESTSRDDLKNYISAKYPNERRPGLVLNQIITFYKIMKNGDWIVIPSEGTKKIAIGKIEGFGGEFTHKIICDENKIVREYSKCDFSNKRHVEWYKQADVENDLYLTRALRAQQTISDITDISEFIFRNLFPCYIQGMAAHFTLQKRSGDVYGFKESITIQSSIQQILDNTSNLYSDVNISDEMQLKTAVGSPGFIEMIIPMIHMIGFPTVAVFFVILSKAKDNNGNDYSGIAAIITAFNNFIDSFLSRHQREAVAHKIEAEARKIDAESRLLDAQTRKADAETTLLKMQYSDEKAKRDNLNKEIQSEINGSKLLNYYDNLSESNKSERISKIESASKRLETATKDSGMFFSDSEKGNK